MLVILFKVIFILIAIICALVVVSGILYLICEIQEIRNGKSLW